MHRLPQLPDFDASAYPELSSIFRSIDAGIAAIVAADPAFRPKPVHRLGQPSGKRAGTQASRGRVARRAA
jgi:hypothetical protein